MNLHAVAEECRGIALQKGFDDCTWENLPTKLVFVVSEMDEACEAGYEAPMVLQGALQLEANRFGEELADVAIRTLVLLETLWPDWSEGRITARRPTALSKYDKLEVMLWPLLRYGVKALHCWRMELRKDTQQCLELLLLELWRLADRLDVDLYAEIMSKMVKNRSRPLLNGKKRSEG